MVKILFLKQDLWSLGPIKHIDIKNTIIKMNDALNFNFYTLLLPKISSNHPFQNQGY